MKVGNRIRIKVTHPRGLYEATIREHGDVYIITKINDNDVRELDVYSVKTGRGFCLTERYYKIDVILNEYVPIELPEELFKI